MNDRRLGSLANFRVVSLAHIIVLNEMKDFLATNIDNDAILTLSGNFGDALGADTCSGELLGSIGLGLIASQTDFGGDKHFFAVHILDGPNGRDGFGAAAKIFVKCLADSVVLQKVNNIPRLECILTAIGLLELALGATTGTRQGDFSRLGLTFGHEAQA